MTPHEAMQAIESAEFAAYANVASDFRTFARAVSQHDAPRTLRKALHAPAQCLAVLRQVWALTRQGIDTRYENPWDTALAVYLLLMSVQDLALAQIAAREVMHAPQCWWALKMARHLLLERQTRHSEERPKSVFFPVSRVIRMTQTSHDGACMHLGDFLPNLANINRVVQVNKRQREVSDHTMTQQWPLGQRGERIVNTYPQQSSNTSVSTHEFAL